MSVIETRELRKHYGRIQALKGVSLSVEKGQIYGLLGQNGAGKTTLIKILLGIAQDRPTATPQLLGQPAGTIGRPRAASAICPKTTSSPATTPATR